MNILVLYNNRRNNYNHFCNADFYKDLNQIPFVNVKMYGIDIESIYPSLLLTKYSRSIKMVDLYEKYKFDVILIAGKNRTYYSAKEQISWLPSDFDNYNCLKVLIEPDYHKYRKDSWFLDRNIDIFLHRHKSNVIRGIEDYPNHEHLWFPFSVDTNLFRSTTEDRINKICFVGNFKSNSYFFRKKSTHILEKEGLIDIKGTVYEENYIKSLKKYTVYLSGSSIYTIDYAKAFEIISSGGILFTDDCPNGFNELFENNYVTYKKDFSDIINKAKMIIDEPDYQKQLVESGLNNIKNRHTHLIRCQELVNILSDKKLCSESNIVQPIEHEIVSELDIVYCIGDLDNTALLRFKNSYNSLIKNNQKLNICISDVGTSSQREIIKSFIPEFKYYYQKEDSFNASIAKNNAYKHLIYNKLFVLMDVDIIVNKDFIEKILNFYNKKRKPFNFFHIKLPKLKEYKYQNIEKKIEHLNLRKIPTSGVMACDKDTYKELNGYDEDYIGWGARDSDFILRAKYAKKLAYNKEILVFHQFHEPQDIKNQSMLDNRRRYRQREKLYTKKRIKLDEINGLEKNLNPGRDSELIDDISNFKRIEELVDNEIKVCLLNKTCLEYSNNRTLYSELELGVDNISLAKELLQDYPVSLSSFPKRTKPMFLNDLTIYVPFPLVEYLQETKRRIEKKEAM